MLVTFDASDLRSKGFAFTGALHGESHRALRAQAAETFYRFQTNEYWKQGTRKTARSFKVGRVTDLHLTVTSNYRIAHFLNVGTRPHVIQRNKAPALTFFWAKMGRIVSFIRVRHPGTKPRAIDQKEAFRSLPELLIKGDAAAAAAVQKAGLG